MAVYQLTKNKKNKFVCPKCQRELYFVEGGSVCIVNGRADMNAVLPKYECEHCKLYYQELLGSGYYEEYDLPSDHVYRSKRQKKLIRTGDLQPMELKRDANNQCVCPRCGEYMDYVEGRPVQIVNGKPDMENVKDHFHCDNCDSMFRRIATTDYFQWSEK